MPKLVIFDLDRTIVRFGTYTPFLLWYAWHNAPLRLLLAPVMLLAMIGYKLKLYSRSRLKEVMFGLMVGRVSAERMAPIAETFADITVSKNCYKEAVAAVDHHKRRGDTLILATASFSFYAEPIGRKLGFNHVIATQLLEEGGMLLPKIVGENCYGEAKREMIQALIAKLEIPGVSTLFYTDDHSDIPTLKVADAGVAVNPTVKLKQYATTSSTVQITNWQ